MKLYGDSKSGNCYKIQLALSLLNIEYEFVAINILDGETQTPEFLQLNPNGKIPLLVLDDGTCLAESNAILYYLAVGTALFPDDKIEQALCLQWQNFEQYSHEPNIAVARFIEHYLGLPEARLAEYQAKQAGGYKALDVMENHLKTHPFFAGNTLSIADISLYAYTHVAHQGGFDLSRYSAINAWFKRIESSDGFIAMQST